MAEVQGIENLVSASKFLKTSLEKSRALSSALDRTGPRLEEINQRLTSLKSDFKPISTQKCELKSLRDHIDQAIGPAAAVLKVFDAILEVEKSFSSDPGSDISAYLSAIKRLEEALKFLADNCRLAIQWLEGIAEFLEENAVANDRYILNVKKSLRILQTLQATRECACLRGGILSAAFGKLEFEFEEILKENSFPLALSSTAGQSCIALSPMPVAVTKKLQAIIERLNANNRLEKCTSIYIQVRGLNAKRSLQALDLDYLEKSITEFEDVQDIEGDIDQWCKHLEFAVKNLFTLEYRLCEEVFETSGSDVRMGCLAKIAIQSGILSFIRFGKQVTKSKNDPIKLLKLLDIFAVLDKLRMDFNRVFGGELCIKIRNLTRDLINSIVNDACEIFRELPVQVGLQRQSSPPLDCSVPRLVSFVTDYCNQLLGENYRPILTQVLVIYQSWKQEKFQEELLTIQVYTIMKEIGLNLDAWSKAYENITSSYLFMMNNHCHFSNLKGTKLGDLMGDSWLRAHEQYKDNYAALYFREGKSSSSLKNSNTNTYTMTRHTMSNMSD